MMTRKYPLLTKEEQEELRRMRKEANISIPKIAEYMHTYPSKIQQLERGETGVDPNFVEKVKKRYQLLIKYKNI
jgi:transcriptional regulator with XRE-family HTH domain